MLILSIDENTEMESVFISAGDDIHIFYVFY